MTLFSQPQSNPHSPERQLHLTPEQERVRLLNVALAFITVAVNNMQSKTVETLALQDEYSTNITPIDVNSSQRPITQSQAQASVQDAYNVPYKTAPTAQQESNPAVLTTTQYAHSPETLQSRFLQANNRVV